MANLEIASVCNLDCPYCFAQNYMSDKTSHQNGNFISIKDYQLHLDFLDRSNIDQVRLIGGEPTLHPEFPVLVRMAMERHKKIAVFSNGLIPQKALTTLIALPAESCIVLINTNASRRNGVLGDREKQQRNHSIQILNGRVLLGYTIFSPAFDMSELLLLINKLGCHKVIRVGLAHPVHSNYLSSIHPKKYWFIGQKIFQFIQEANQCGIRLEFDCGFVPCMFTMEQIESMKSYNTLLGWNCSPVLDVHISGNIIMCFPNEGLADVQISDRSEAGQIRAEMLANTSFYRSIGIYPECSVCDFKKNKICAGGGLEHVKQRYRYANFQTNILV